MMRTLGRGSRGWGALALALVLAVILALAFLNRMTCGSAGERGSIAVQRTILKPSPTTTVIMGYWQLESSKRVPEYYLQSVRRNAAALGRRMPRPPLIFLAGSAAWCNDVEASYLSPSSPPDGLGGGKEPPTFSCQVIPFHHLPGRNLAHAFVGQNCSAKGNKALGPGVLRDMAAIYLSKIDLVSELVDSGAVQTRSAAWVDAGLPASYSRVLNVALDRPPAETDEILVNAYCTGAASKAFGFDAPRTDHQELSSLSAGARAGMFLDGRLFGSKECFAAYGQPPAKAGIILGSVGAWKRLRPRFDSARTMAIRDADRIGCRCVDEEAILARMLNYDDHNGKEGGGGKGEGPAPPSLALLDPASITGARNPSKGCKSFQ